ncbi:MAG: thiamine pyrophosphate-dependent dehydrogenase E1 component subunit alpha [Chloroflexi bacterium]|nr:thiamine pyrophosphate-dependent dehydrogenase E1 component subunit alpha [Chloroflexota bacterium]MBI4198611.1 thiamine pyrophosphate-dependent dehydrogenase E1 component subunit alpha [Chloroflexota bacterium]
MPTPRTSGGAERFELNAGRLDLSPEDMLEMYSTMVLVRALDERIWLMNRQGKAAIVASCQGHEAAQLGAVWAMRQAPSAAYFPYYRDMALAIGLGVTPKETMLGFLAKEGERHSGARQFGLQGIRPDLKLFNNSNVVSTQIPHAVGYALGCKLSREPAAVITCFGDGGASQGDCHEGMNFAAVHKLPVIFFCENNRYAISVPLHKQMAVEHVADRAPGYGMAGVIVDGTDILATYQATQKAVQRALRGEGPTLLEAKVERYLPHTSDDDDTRYRPREEVQEARKHDPLRLFRELLLGKGILTEALDQRFQQQAKAEVNEATEFAEQAPYPEPDDFYEHVYGRV